MRRSLGWLTVSAIPGVLPGVAMSPLILTALMHGQDARAWCLWLPAIPPAAAVLALPLACRQESRPAKPVFLTALTVARLAMVIGFIALLPGIGSGSLLFASFAIYSLVLATAAGSCMAWFHALLPPRVQGSYLGRRNAISAVAGCLCTLVLSAAMAHPMALGLADSAAVGRILFAASLAMAAIDLAILRRVGDGRRPGGSGVGSAFARLRQIRLWRLAILPVLAGLGGAIAAPVSLVLWYDLGLDALQVGAVGIAGMLGAAAGQWLGGNLADRIAPVRLLARAAAAQAAGLAAMLAIAILAGRGLLGSTSLCAAGIVIAAATAAPAAIAAGAQMKLLFAGVPQGSAGDFACIGTIGSLLGLGLAGAAGAAALWLQGQAAVLPTGMPTAAPLLALAVLAACIGHHMLLRREIRP